MPNPKPPELRPFKIIGELRGALYDEDGDIVGELKIADVELHRKRFGSNISDLADEACIRFKEREAAEIEQSKEIEQIIEESRGKTGGN